MESCWSKGEVRGKRVKFEKVGMVILTIEIMGEIVRR